jgi:hypothetical protein
MSKSVLSIPAAQFQDGVRGCVDSASPRFALAELNSLLADLAIPEWTRSIAPLAEPVFGSELQSLRLYLLTHSPPPFRARNIFIDATLGDRV